MSDRLDLNHSALVLSLCVSVSSWKDWFCVRFMVPSRVADQYTICWQTMEQKKTSLDYFLGLVGLTGSGDEAGSEARSEEDWPMVNENTASDIRDGRPNPPLERCHLLVEHSPTLSSRLIRWIWAIDKRWSLIKKRKSCSSEKVTYERLMADEVWDGMEVWYRCTIW